MTLPPALQSHIDRILAAWPQAAVLFKAMSFAFIGVINVMVDVTFFTLGCMVIVALGHAPSIGQVAGVPLVAANTVSWCIAVSGSYVMNSMVTFARETGRQLSPRAYFTFVASGLFGLAVGTAVLVVGSRYLPIWGAKGCAILASFVVNFSMSHFVVFRSRQPGTVPFEHDVV